LIKAAAIKFKGKVYWVPQPGRHHNVAKKIVAEMGLPVLNEIQGFITDQDIFVTRLEAAEIAYAAGQVEDLDAPPLLYTSDLW
jgi:hypothetical protein